MEIIHLDCLINRFREYLEQEDILLSSLDQNVVKAFNQARLINMSLMAVDGVKAKIEQFSLPEMTFIEVAEALILITSADERKTINAMQFIWRNSVHEIAAALNQNSNI